MSGEHYLSDWLVGRRGGRDCERMGTTLLYCKGGRREGLRGGRGVEERRRMVGCLSCFGSHTDVQIGF